VNFFFNLPNPHYALRIIQPLTELSTRSRKMFLGIRARSVRKAENLSSSVSRLSRQYRILKISQHYRPPRPVTGIALLYGDGVCFLLGTNLTVSTAASSQYLAVNCEPTV
jgi:hypothetical protein